MVYSPLDALRIAKRNPDRTVVFFAIGFETTAPSTALTMKAREGRGGRELPLHVQPRDHRAAPAGVAGVARPAAGRYIGAGTRLDLIGVRRLSSSRGMTGPGRRGLRAARHPAVDRMILRSCGRAAARSNQYSESSPERGEQGRSRCGRGLRAAAALRVARPELYHAGALRSPRLRGFDAERPYVVPGARVADPKACQCGEVLRVFKPWECKVSAPPVRPRRDRHPHGLFEGACAAYYNYGRYARNQMGGGRVKTPQAPVSRTASSGSCRSSRPHGRSGRGSRTSA